MLHFKICTAKNTEITIDDIINNNCVGMVVYEAIDDKEIAVLNNCIDHLKEAFYTDLNNGNGFSLPGMFGQLHKTQPLSSVNSYFANVVPFTEKCNQVCEFSLYSWLVEKLSFYLVPYKLEVLPSLLPYSFRVVFPKRGGLFVHKDNKLLPLIHDSVSDKILQLIMPETMMSWYFTLQSPNEGGELWVADNQYADYEKEGQFDMLSPHNEKISVDDMNHIKVKTPTGSLLIFNGGSYWHKVIPPSDNSGNRITFGGFMAKAFEKDVIYFWS